MPVTIINFILNSIFFIKIDGIHFSCIVLPNVLRDIEPESHAIVTFNRLNCAYYTKMQRF